VRFNGHLLYWMSARERPCARLRGEISACDYRDPPAHLGRSQETHAMKMIRQGKRMTWTHEMLGKLVSGGSYLDIEDFIPPWGCITLIPKLLELSL
jgi:hypothetical protein